MHSNNHMMTRIETILLDASAPRSLVNLVPDALASRIRSLANGDNRSLIGLTERQLKRQMTLAGKSPSATDSRLRLQFWLEYDRVQNDKERNEPLNMAYVIKNNITKEGFYGNYILDDYSLAYLLCMPTKYADLIEEVLVSSTNKLIAVIDAIDEEKPDVKVLEFLRKISDEYAERSGRATGAKTHKKGSHEGEAEGPSQDEPVDFEAKFRAEQEEIQRLQVQKDERERRATGGIA